MPNLLIWVTYCFSFELFAHFRNDFSSIELNLPKILHRLLNITRTIVANQRPFVENQTDFFLVIINIRLSSFVLSNKTFRPIFDFFSLNSHIFPFYSAAWTDIWFESHYQLHKHKSSPIIQNFIFTVEYIERSIENCRR